MTISCYCFFFFFQAEDGIRDYKVTGVQTCALPIYLALLRMDIHQPLDIARRLQLIAQRHGARGQGNAAEIDEAASIDADAVLIRKNQIGAGAIDIDGSCDMRGRSGKNPRHDGPRLDPLIQEGKSSLAHIELAEAVV